MRDHQTNQPTNQQTNKSERTYILTYDQHPKIACKRKSSIVIQMHAVKQCRWLWTNIPLFGTY